MTVTVRVHHAGALITALHPAPSINSGKLSHKWAAPFLHLDYRMSKMLAQPLRGNSACSKPYRRLYAALSKE